MDNSQSSDVFSDSTEYAREVTETSSQQMDIVAFEHLVCNTKLKLCKNITNELQKPTFITYFSTVLKDCETCIFKSIDMVMELLSVRDVNTTQLCEYLDDSVNILQLLTSFIRTVVESVSMSCCKMKIFPTTTGRIILAVFTHCKDSESLYGSLLRNVEKELKDLFRNCHELQLTYLMVLEKQFIFDLNNTQELDILNEALEINLKIGEIVQTLDVKTMAAQWKAYTMICEKHSNDLKNRKIYQNCSKILCTMTEHNIKTAIETDQEDKIVVRSLKVASFTLKILLRVCNIFKHATDKNYKHIIDLLLCIYLNNASYLHSIAGKSPQFINLMNTNVINASEALLKELLVDEKFVNSLATFNIERIEKDDQLLSYILIIVSAIKYTILGSIQHSKSAIFECVFRWLPYGHTWFNMSLKFEAVGEEKVTNGLYEHLLTSAVSLASTLNSDEVVFLERKLYEALLSTDCYTALFSSNLWELLARLTSTPRHFLLSQLIYLCKTYKKLETHKTFKNSPQQIHLSNTIRKLFKNLNDEEKTRIFTQFDVNDKTYVGLWSVIKIKNLPEGLGFETEKQVIENLKKDFHKDFNSDDDSVEDLDNLIRTMTLSATCSHDVECKDNLDKCLVNAWVKACPSKINIFSNILYRELVWYLEYIRALVALTISVNCVLENISNFVKVVHVISNIFKKDIPELKLVLIDLVWILLQYQFDDEFKHLVEPHLTQILKCLLQNSDIIIKNRLYAEIRKYRLHKNVEIIVYKVLSENSALRDTWDNFTKHGKLNTNNLDLKIELLATSKLEYSHKCIESQMCIELSNFKTVSITRENSNNFDFADIDTLFEVDSDSEPACKRVKLDTNEANEIISRIEKDALLLSQVQENVFKSEHKERLRNVCESLKSIIK